MIASLLENPGMRRAIQWAPVAIFAVMFVYIGVNAPNLLSASALELILKQSIPTVVVSLGLATVVMASGDDVVSGGIDLSIPATAIIGAALIADQVTNQGNPLIYGVVLAALAAVIAGGLNAFLVVGVGMTPLLATLASGVAIVGVTKVITQSKRINVSDPTIIAIRDGDIAGISIGVAATAVICFGFYYLIHQTRWGLHLQASGGSRDAAEISGIKPSRFVMASFMLAAFAGFLASLFVLARGSGSSPGSEENLLLEMVLATFLGAAFSPRRVVTVWGAACGAVLVAALSIGFKSIGVNVFWTGCIKGALILIVVASASAASRTASGGQR